MVCCLGKAFGRADGVLGSLGQTCGKNSAGQYMWPVDNYPLDGQEG